MLIVNPPAAFDEQVGHVLEELQQCLSKGKLCRASTSLQWLTKQNHETGMAFPDEPAGLRTNPRKP